MNHVKINCQVVLGGKIIAKDNTGITWLKTAKKHVVIVKQVVVAKI